MTIEALKEKWKNQARTMDIGGPNLEADEELTSFLTDEVLKELKSQKPVLLLDVDGVINVFDKDNIPLEFHHLMYSWNNQVPIWCSMAKGTTNKLIELMGLFDIYWATAWNENANKITKAIGLPEFPLCPIDCIAYDVNQNLKLVEKGLLDHWKMESIERFVQAELADRAIAFIDDEIASDKWAQARNKLTPTIFVKTNGKYGITEAEMVALRNFHAYTMNGQNIANDTQPEITEET